MDINYKLLNLLNENARYSDGELAVLLGLDEEEVGRQIAEMEDAGLIPSPIPGSRTSPAASWSSTRWRRFTSCRAGTTSA